jgi:hypothetical protein
MIPVVANSLWLASSLREASAFRRAMDDVESTQRSVLLEILRRRGDCAHVRSVAEFQNTVPFSDEPTSTAEAVTRLVPTSGTTAPTKWIPYTRSLEREFRRGIAPWIVDLFRHDPRLLTGRAYWAVSPVADESGPSATTPSISAGWTGAWPTPCRPCRQPSGTSATWTSGGVGRSAT